MLLTGILEKIKYKTDTQAELNDLLAYTERNTRKTVLEAKVLLRIGIPFKPCEVGLALTLFLLGPIMFLLTHNVIVGY